MFVMVSITVSKSRYKVIHLGPNHYAITLPLAWVMGRNIVKGQSLNIEIRSDGTLCITESATPSAMQSHSDFDYLYSNMTSESTDKRVHGDAPLSAETEGNK